IVPGYTDKNSKPRSKAVETPKKPIETFKKEPVSVPQPKVPTGPRADADSRGERRPLSPLPYEEVPGIDLSSLSAAKALRFIKKPRLEEPSSSGNPFSKSLSEYQSSKLVFPVATLHGSDPVIASLVAEKTDLEHRISYLQQQLQLNKKEIERREKEQKTSK
ncbi:hypothetical protein CVT24_008671, partial [Panaeolus cyanescens]